MKVWLVYYNEQDRHYSDEDRVTKQDTEKDALAFVNDAATGQREGVAVKRVFEVDLARGEMHELEAKLEGFKLKLVKKAKP